MTIEGALAAIVLGALFFLGASLLAMSAPALAAAPSRAELNALAKCAVSHDRDAVARVARSLPLSDDPIRLDASKLGRGASCLTGAGIEAPAMLVRGAVAQAFFMADFRETGMKRRNDIGDLADLGAPSADEPVNSAGVALFRLGDCLARNNGEKVDRLMRTSYGSAAAHKIIDSFQPYYAACAPTGADFSANRDTLHAAIAQGAYHAGVRYWRGQLTLVKN